MECVNAIKLECVSVLQTRFYFFFPVGQYKLMKSALMKQFYKVEAIKTSSQFPIDKNHTAARRFSFSNKFEENGMIHNIDMTSHLYFIQMILT